MSIRIASKRSGPRRIDVHGLAAVAGGLDRDAQVLQHLPRDALVQPVVVDDEHAERGPGARAAAGAGAAPGAGGGHATGATAGPSGGLVGSSQRHARRDVAHRRVDPLAVRHAAPLQPAVPAGLLLEAVREVTTAACDAELLNAST